MANSDQVVHSFCIYEIKRHTMRPYNFRWTDFYESNPDFLQLNPDIPIHFAEDELIICSTIIDVSNYSLLTTQRFITRENGIEDSGHIASAKTPTPPLQFRLEKFNYVLGIMQLQNGHELKYFLEAGKPCMVMMCGIKTFIWAQELTDLKMANLMRIWNKRYES